MPLDKSVAYGADGNPIQSGYGDDGFPNQGPARVASARVQAANKPAQATGIPSVADAIKSFGQGLWDIPAGISQMFNPMTYVNAYQHPQETLLAGDISRGNAYFNAGQQTGLPRLASYTEAAGIPLVSDAAHMYNAMEQPLQEALHQPVTQQSQLNALRNYGQVGGMLGTGKISDVVDNTRRPIEYGGGSGKPGVKDYAKLLAPGKLSKLSAVMDIAKKLGADTSPKSTVTPTGAPNLPFDPKAPLSVTESGPRYYTEPPYYETGTDFPFNNPTLGPVPQQPATMLPWAERFKEAAFGNAPGQVPPPITPRQPGADFNLLSPEVTNAGQDVSPSPVIDAAYGEAKVPMPPLAKASTAKKISSSQSVLEKRFEPGRISSSTAQEASLKANAGADILPPDYNQKVLNSSVIKQAQKNNGLISQSNSGSTYLHSVTPDGTHALLEHVGTDGMIKREMVPIQGKVTPPKAAASTRTPAKQEVWNPVTEQFEQPAASATPVLPPPTFLKGVEKLGQPTSVGGFGYGSRYGPSIPPPNPNEFGILQNFYLKGMK